MGPPCLLNQIRTHDTFFTKDDIKDAFMQRSHQHLWIKMMLMFYLLTNPDNYFNEKFEHGKNSYFWSIS